MKKLKLALALVSATYVSSSFAGDYKLAVIDDQLTSDAIALGQYAQVLSLPQNDSQSLESVFETSVNQCAANIKLGNADEAITLCSVAIELIEDVRTSKDTRREMAAYAYSNRGIAHSLKNEFDAALSDFSKAYGNDKNTITRANYKVAKNTLKQANDSLAP
ncbi:hypothetical protein AAEU32_11580 [Pseudoalteromonas sp. SSDWG2]|uniref:hypothetical protein n=1 Tax=Pseudoalteromonas sp. SSDWG2 TaxID=3139391 RepID=UPI003BAD770F